MAFLNKWYYFLILLPLSGYGQTDSLPTLYLNGITLQSFRTEGDTLQNFYKANKSATTESILARMQGISLVRRGAYGQEPMIHGMTAGQINVTIDGMKMFGACTDKMDPVTIYVEPQNLKSINASLGTNGSILGTTVGGSVDMQLADPVIEETKGYTGTAGMGYQSVSNGFNAYSTSNYSWSRSAINAGLVYRKSGNYTDGDGHEVLYSQYEKVNFSTAYKKIWANRSIKGDLLIDIGRTIGFPALPMDVGKAAAHIFSVTYEQAQPIAIVETMKVKVYGNSIYHRMDDSQRPDVVMHMDMPGWSNTFGAYLENDWTAIGTHSLRSRLDFYSNHVQADMTMYPVGESPMYMQTWPDSRRSVTGLFVSDAIRFGNNRRLDLNARVDVASTLLNPGIGYDQLLVFYPELGSGTVTVTGSANAEYAMSMGARSRAQFHIGYGERLPTTSELFGFYLFNRQDRYDYLGNPYLRRERSYAADITTSYFGKSIELKGHLYYQHCPDYITAFIDSSIDPMTPGASGTKVYTHVDWASFAGFDAMVSFKPTESLQLLSTVKATYARTFDGDYLPYIPPLKNVTSVVYSAGDFKLQGEYEGAARQQRVSTYTGEASTPSYHVLNFRAGYERKVQSLSYVLSAGVENLTDLYYREHLDWGGIPRPGRNVYLTLEVRFN